MVSDGIDGHFLPSPFRIVAPALQSNIASSDPSNPQLVIAYSNIGAGGLFDLFFFS